MWAMCLLNTEGNSKQEDACWRTPVMRTEGKELIMFASDFHSQLFPRGLCCLRSPPNSSAFLFIWLHLWIPKREHSVEEEMKRASPSGWRRRQKFQLPYLEGGRGKRERAKEGGNGWEQDEKGENKEDRQRPELRSGGRVSDAWQPRAEQGALLGLQDKPTEVHWVGEIFQDFCLEKKFKVLVQSSGPSRSVALFSRREKLGHDARLIGMIGVDIIQVAGGFEKKGHAYWCCTFQFLNVGMIWWHHKGR